MRSGFDKPGALPLLILIVFSLLTLVPSLPNLYHSKFADFSFYTGAAPQVPLLQDSVAELTPKAHPLNEPRKSWVLAASHRSRGNRPPLTARVGNAAVVPASETTVTNKSRLSSLTRESSFSFGRRARAFRTYFIQQLDDYPFLTSFSNRSLAASKHPYPTMTINETLPTADNESPSTPSYNHPDSVQSPLLPFPASLRDICQQACHIAVDIGKRVALHGANYAKSIFLPEQITGAPAPLISHPPNAVSDQDPFTPSEQSPQQKVGAEDSTDAAAGRHSQELHGSCMAVVIGLVAGIMWF
ncbi:hypothetical protein N7491_006713 [Penicillium cf. griseofulvum]|uniref:Uncharacterized protein n=1 Tax=Penicillium cf. griseofulvum TaxID=2972120 RepID=A0A9W9IV92_9EURO|nr:hypothetical protein N7472_010260 [Penicillium cf. griseofulvum]KAJ5429697.1 hypothetical protein N7491_006713 [Penicillium cf. griseofulvum]KAJ5436536.1 hypothetical protein N7445_007421 [Penicillium cf. griseofulvum]